MGLCKYFGLKAMQFSLYPLDLQCLCRIKEKSRFSYSIDFTTVTIITNSNTNETIGKVNTHVQNLIAPPSTTPAQIMPSSTLFTFEYNSKNTKYNIQNTKYKKQKTKYKIQNTKHKIQIQRHEENRGSYPTLANKNLGRQ